LDDGTFISLYLGASPGSVPRPSVQSIVTSTP
jgi:hypothetical protein